jgi:DNA-directed RNA polymerase specialized sigma24 family protein
LEATKPLWNSLYRFALSLVHGKAESEDLVQIALLKGFQGYQRFFENNFPGIQTPEEASSF